jgi:hypothetical protein
MIKTFLTAIILLFLIPAEFSFSQAAPVSIKIYSGYLHHNVKSKASLWHTLFGARSDKQEEVLYDRQCWVEFKSPVSFLHRPVVIMPERLTYFIRFKNGLQSSPANALKENGPSGKIIIKIYTNDDQQYSLDPGSEGKQVGINDGHHIFDAYLIYLILGSTIDHLEITSPSGEDHDKYVLDKLEIQDNP